MLIPASFSDFCQVLASVAAAGAYVAAGGLQPPRRLCTRLVHGIRWSMVAFGVPPTIANFRENHSAYKFVVGLRPISLVGAEVAYVDFGHPNRTVGTIPLGGAVPISADVKMKGSAAFGVLYLPVPVVDIYVKAGLARLQTTENATFTLPAPFATCVVSGGPHCQFSARNDVTNTGLAMGAGAQYKFGSWTVRAEYERFNAAGGHPSLLSGGITWTFF